MVVYRVRPYYLPLGIVCSGFFFLAGVGSVYAAVFNIDGSFANPLFAAGLFGMVWTLMTCLGIWLIALALRYRLIMDRHGFRQVGVLSDREMTFDSIEKIKWKNWTAGGSLRIWNSQGAMTLDFSNFTQDEKQALVDQFRQSVAWECQTDWDRFSKQSNVADQARSTHSLRWLGGIAILFGMVSTVIWLLGFGGIHLAMAVINTAVGLWLLYVNRRRQR